jgi:adenosylhomocysteine nucleosidase
MPIRSLLQAWLANAAKAKMREAVVQTAQQQLTQATAAPTASGELKPCDVGIVFALGIESGCLEDRLEGCVTIRGHDFVAREGGLKGRRVLLALSGAGRPSAAHTTEVLIDGHQPKMVISAGFAGGLSPRLRRNDILLANCVLTGDGGELPVPWPANVAVFAQQSGVHAGGLLTVDQIVRLPRQKRSLHERYGATAVDMETFAVAEVCRRREIPFLAVRVVHDAVDDVLPDDVEYLLQQKTHAARLGAAFAAALRRPGSVKDMYRLREEALVASDRLARFLLGLIGAI